MVLFWLFIPVDNNFQVIYVVLWKIVLYLDALFLRFSLRVSLVKAVLRIDFLIAQFHCCVFFHKVFFSCFFLCCCYSGRTCSALKAASLPKTLLARHLSILTTCRVLFYYSYLNAIVMKLFSGMDRKPAGFFVSATCAILF